MDRTVDWDDSGEGAVTAVDQRALPGEYRIRRLATVDELVAAIADLAIRGAPALGAAGALGVALAARRHARRQPTPGARRGGPGRGGPARPR